MGNTTKEQLSKHRSLRGVARVYFIAASAISLFLAINYNFNLSIGGLTFVNNGYLYALLGLYLPLVFLIFPPVRTRKALDRIPWYDYVIAFAIVFSCLYLITNSSKMVRMSWEYNAPLMGTVVAAIIFFSVLEAARRTCGSVFFFVVLFFGCYALFANKMPGFLYGKSYPFWKNITFHSLGSDSIVGIPMRTTGSILIGFMIFAVALMETGAGKFFIDLAEALLGYVRGGSAKVSIFSSALMGSISGSVISNVLATGSFTIPAMKKSGYPAHYAGAVEACASTGGTIMPPVMGAAAFVMAEMLQVSYSKIIIAALIPSLLYFSCLFFQVDAYAAVNGIKGASRSECPKLRNVMKDGWFYLVGIFLLIFLVLFFNREAQAAWISTLALLLLSFNSKNDRLNLKKIISFIEKSGQFMAEITAILAGCGLIVGAMVFTGIANSFAVEIVVIAGNNTFLLLFFGAFTCFILGMGMTITACYIFLALVFAPALVAAGLDKMAVHFFILYWGMASYITPPVAMGAFAASTIANSSPMKTGLHSMRLGIAAYFVPFFFVLNPALVAQGPLLNILTCTLTALVGLGLIGLAIEGYFFGIGKLPFWSRPLLIISGSLLGYPFYSSDLYGLLLMTLTLISIVVLKRIKNKDKGILPYITE